jgi:hypothetical protein
MMTRTAALACAFACALISAPGAVAAPGFETAPVLKAGNILPPELLKGEHHRVAEEVRTDGYLNYYVIDSDFGEFVAEGTPLLRIRVHEIEALAQLVEISETDVFIEATKEEGIDLVKGLRRGVSDIPRSVKLVPKGTSRLFEKFGHGAKLGVKKAGDLIGVGDDEDESANDTEEIRESYYEVSQGEREWAARLDVDPYSSNETLRKAIGRMSTIDFAGEVTFSVASSVAIPIPGLGMVASTINEATDEIWNTDPYELRQANIERLQEAGVTESTIEAFIDHPWYTPTMQTLLLRYLLGMEGVSGTMTVLDVAVEAETEAEARYFVNSILLMVWFHENEVPVERVLAQSHLPQAVTKDGRQIGFGPLDYLFWGEDFARAAQVAVSRPVLGKREIWVLGSVSDRARAEIEALGVAVHDQMENYALAKMAEDSRSDDVTEEEPANEE